MRLDTLIRCINRDLYPTVRIIFREHIVNKEKKNKQRVVYRLTVQHLKETTGGYKTNYRKTFHSGDPTQIEVDPGTILPAEHVHVCR